MNQDKATIDALRRYKPVVWGKKRKVTPEVSRRVHEIASYYARDRYNTESGEMSIWVDSDMSATASALFRRVGMFASFDYDGDNPAMCRMAEMFETVMLVNMTALAVAEQEQENGKPYPDDKLRAMMLSSMDVVYEEMMKLQIHRKNPGDTGFNR